MSNPFDWDHYDAAIMAAAEQQLDHLRWHGETLHHWHVGVTALDNGNHRTENFRTLYGARIYRMLDLPRNAIIAVPNTRMGCHR